MKNLLSEIINILRETDRIGSSDLAAIIRRHNRNIHKVEEHFSKKKLILQYLQERHNRTDWWRSQSIDPKLDERIINTLQLKPRRTASGVATITVITKPMPCSGGCAFCPNDVRMPKSYLTDEPACQRAERNYFDPYLQVASRLKALREMGHETDKVEIIVLGGSWTDYPAAYQLWFATELFRALNEEDHAEAAEIRRGRYRACGIESEADALAAQTRNVQNLVNAGELGYNQAFRLLYESPADDGEQNAWQKASAWQTASLEELKDAQVANEDAAHRMVGLVFETRPNAVTIDNLIMLRRMGATKVQIGVQTLNPAVMKANDRQIDANRIAEAFALLRLFGYKIHAHFMVNLAGSTPQLDREDYLKFISSKDYLPDEIKLYPCVLVEGTKLCKMHEKGEWSPYDEETLVETLGFDVMSTPPFMRISRMIRDISAHDIKAGNRKTNLRQLVEEHLREAPLANREIRMREISVSDVDLDALKLDEIVYDTAVSQEHFLQWVTPEGRIAGFLRLSLPRPEVISAHDGIPIAVNEAMIREVHVYGRVARIGNSGSNAQHTGLGKALVERACEIAAAHGRVRVKVISSVGTRNYYRKLKFEDDALYQTRRL